MVKCPYCESLIDHLLLEGKAYSKLLAGGNYETQEPDFDSCGDYLCPLCGCIVATKEEDAVDFLNKGEEAQSYDWKLLSQEELAHLVETETDSNMVAVLIQHIIASLKWQKAHKMRCDLCESIAKKLNLVIR